MLQRQETDPWYSFLSVKTPVSVRAQMGSSELHDAVLGDLNLARQCLDTARKHGTLGVVINRRNVEGYSPLMNASALMSETDSVDLMTLLLEAGADVRAVDNDGFTALHWAASVGENTRCALLISHGADPNARSVSGETPLHRACRFGRVSALSALLTSGAVVTQRNKSCLTPVDVAGRYDGVPNKEYRDAALRMLMAHDPRQRTAVFSHPDCLAHVTRAGHQEAPERVTAIMERVRDPMRFAEHELSLLCSDADVPLATETQVLRAHSVQYWRLVRALASHVERRGDPSYGIPFTPMVQRGLRRATEGQLKPSEHSDTTFSTGSFPAALRAAGAVCAAVEAVARGDARHALCVVRPPGHHAGVNGLMTDLPSSQSCGFCIFNSVAIGALHALEGLRPAPCNGNDSGSSDATPALSSSSSSASSTLSSAAPPLLSSSSRSALSIGTTAASGVSAGANGHTAAAAGAAAGTPQQPRRSAAPAPPRIRRVAIIDIDVHHGNGTEEIVRRWADAHRDERDGKALFFFSSHLFDIERRRDGGGGGGGAAADADAPAANSSANNEGGAGTAAGEAASAGAAEGGGGSADGGEGGAKAARATKMKTRRSSRTAAVAATTEPFDPTGNGADAEDNGTVVDETDAASVATSGELYYAGRTILAPAAAPSATSSAAAAGSISAAPARARQRAKSSKAGAARQHQQHQQHNHHAYSAVEQQGQQQPPPYFAVPSLAAAIAAATGVVSDESAAAAVGAAPGAAVSKRGGGVVGQKRLRFRVSSAPPSDDDASASAHGNRAPLPDGVPFGTVFYPRHPPGSAAKREREDGAVVVAGGAGATPARGFKTTAAPSSSLAAGHQRPPDTPATAAELGAANSSGGGGGGVDGAQAQGGDAVFALGSPFLVRAAIVTALGAGSTPDGLSAGASSSAKGKQATSSAVKRSKSGSAVKQLRLQSGEDEESDGVLGRHRSGGGEKKRGGSRDRSGSVGGIDELILAAEAAAATATAPAAVPIATAAGPAVDASLPPSSSEDTAPAQHQHPGPLASGVVDATAPPRVKRSRRGEVKVMRPPSAPSAPPPVAAESVGVPTTAATAASSSAPSISELKAADAAAVAPSSRVAPSSALDCHTSISVPAPVPVIVPMNVADAVSTTAAALAHRGPFPSPPPERTHGRLSSGLQLQTTAAASAAGAAVAVPSNNAREAAGRAVPPPALSTATSIRVASHPAVGFIPLPPRSTGLASALGFDSSSAGAGVGDPDIDDLIEQHVTAGGISLTPRAVPLFLGPHSSRSPPISSGGLRRMGTMVGFSAPRQLHLPSSSTSSASSSSSSSAAGGSGVQNALSVASNHSSSGSSSSSSRNSLQTRVSGGLEHPIGRQDSEGYFAIRQFPSGGTGAAAPMSSPTAASAAAPTATAAASARGTVKGSPQSPTGAPGRLLTVAPVPATTAASGDSASAAAGTREPAQMMNSRSQLVSGAESVGSLSPGYRPRAASTASSVATNGLTLGGSRASSACTASERASGSGSTSNSGSGSADGRALDWSLPLSSRPADAKTLLHPIPVVSVSDAAAADGVREYRSDGVAMRMLVSGPPPTTAAEVAEAGAAGAPRAFPQPPPPHVLPRPGVVVDGGEAGGAAAAAAGSLDDADIVYSFYPSTGYEDCLDANVMNAPIAPLWRLRPEHRNKQRNPLKATFGRLAVRRAIAQRLIPALRAFSPDLILMSSGFDGAAGDVGNTKTDGKVRVFVFMFMETDGKVRVINTCVIIYMCMYAKMARAVIFI